MIHRGLLVLAVVLLGAGSAIAQQGPGAPLSLDGCLAIALERNPLVLQSKESHQAALARVYQARALPQPTFSYDSDLQPRPLQFGQSGESYLGFSQAIEFPGKRDVRGRIAAAEAGGVATDLDTVRLDLTFRVTEAFYRLLFAQERLGLAEEDRRLSEEFLAQTRHKHETGDVAQVEVLRAQVEAARASSAVRQTRNEVEVARASLAFFLGRPGDASLSVAGALQQPPLASDLAALKERAIALRPEIKAVQFVVNAERLRQRQAGQAYLPDFEVGFARHRVAGQATSWDITFSVPIPVFFWQPKKGEIAEARANASRAEREAEHLRNTILLEVEEAYRNARTAQEQIAHLEQEILAKARESYEMFAFAYQEGEIEGLELIAARRTLLEARQSYAEALYNSSVATAALSRAVGQGAGSL